MMAPGDRVLVGVSGGPDSMALLHLLSRLAPDLKIRLGVAHLNHGLRGASAEPGEGFADGSDIGRIVLAALACSVGAMKGKDVLCQIDSNRCDSHDSPFQ